MSGRPSPLPVSQWHTLKSERKTLSDARSTKQYTTKIWPDLTFTVGRAQPVKGDRGKHPLSGITTEMGVISFTSESPDYDFDPEKAGQVIHDLYQAEAISLEKTVEAVENLEKKARSPLSLAGACNSHRLSSREKRGRKGITTYNKKMVRSAGVLLENKFGRRNLMFGTVTLPPLNPADFSVIRTQWSEITRKFFQELSRLLIRRGLSGAYTYVTEIQERRFEKWGVIAPHLHWVSQGRTWRDPDGSWRVSPEEIAEVWGRMLSNALGRPVGAGFSTELQMPKKSLAAEMGKYLSKGCSMIEIFREKGLLEEMPTSWSGVSLKLKRAVKKAVIHDSGDLAKLLVDSLDALQSCSHINFRRIYWHNPDSGVDVPVGVSGWWRSSESLQEFLNLFREQPLLKVA